VFPIAATVAVLDAGGGAAEIGIVLGARWLAVVLFALVGGVWADRLSRRLVMMSADAFRAVVLVILALLPGTPPVLVLASLVFLVGAGEAFFRPAESALLPRLVPEERRNQANGLVMLSYRSAAVVGPGIGGLLVATVGVRSAYAVDAFTFAASLWFVRGIREPAREARAERASMLSEIKEGWREVTNRPWIFGILVWASLLLLLVLAPTIVLLPVVGREEFGTDAVFASALAMMSLGGVAGALIAMRWRPRQPGLASISLTWLFLLVIGVLAFPVSVGAILVAYFLAGIALEPFAVFWSTALQREIPPDKMARVTRVDWMASFALMPIGLAMTGPIEAVIGQQWLLAGSAVSLVLLTLGVLFVPGVRQMGSPHGSEGGRVQRR